MHKLPNNLTIVTKLPSMVFLLGCPCCMVHRKVKWLTVGVVWWKWSTLIQIVRNAKWSVMFRLHKAGGGKKDRLSGRNTHTHTHTHTHTRTHTHAHTNALKHIYTKRTHSGCPRVNKNNFACWPSKPDSQVAIHVWLDTFNSRDSYLWQKSKFVQNHVGTGKLLLDVSESLEQPAFFVQVLLNRGTQRLMFSGRVNVKDCMKS